jgi:tripartite-type tricarboxylate transporter receptor subunit TctC
MRKFAFCAAVVAMSAGPVVLSATSAAADAVKDFYSGQGKKMQFVIRSTPGGGYDLLTRLLARHLGRFIPGNPNITPVNMPGGGGIVAANYLYLIAPKDGTVLEIISQGLTVDQALGLSPQLKADMKKLNWIASVVNSNQLLVTWNTSKTKNLDDARKRETTIGSTGAGSVSVQLPALYNNVLGTKFKIIFGYRGGHAIDLAMERGEVEGRGTNPYTDWMAAKPTWIPQKKIIPIIQVGLKKEEALPEVPLLLDQKVSAEHKPVVEFMSKAATLGRPLATTPGVPKERVAALRKAFFEMIKNPRFIEDAKRSNSTIRPQSGDDLAALVASIIDTPQEVKDRVKSVLRPKDEDAKRIEGKKK